MEKYNPLIRLNPYTVSSFHTHHFLENGILWWKILFSNHPSKLRYAHLDHSRAQWACTCFTRFQKWSPKLVQARLSSSHKYASLFLRMGGKFCRNVRSKDQRSTERRREERLKEALFLHCIFFFIKRLLAQSSNKNATGNCMDCWWVGSESYDAKFNRFENNID